MTIDKFFHCTPSKAINTVILGTKGSSLCGRLYLYQRFVSRSSVVVNMSLCLIDSLETDHCKTSARHWRIRSKREGVFLPEAYKHGMGGRGMAVRDEFSWTIIFRGKLKSVLLKNLTTKQIHAIMDNDPVIDDWAQDAFEEELLRRK